VPDLLAMLPSSPTCDAPDLLAPAASTLGSAKLEVASGEESSRPRRSNPSPLRRGCAADLGSAATAPHPTAAPRHEVRGERRGEEGDGEGGGSGDQSRREG
jgi:hypothetical protein